MTLDQVLKRGRVDFGRIFVVNDWNFIVHYGNIGTLTVPVEKIVSAPTGLRNRWSFVDVSREVITYTPKSTLPLFKT